MSDLERLREELHAFFTAKHHNANRSGLEFRSGEIKLLMLNVGTNHHREYHWRFRTPDGSIINVSIEREEPES